MNSKTIEAQKVTIFHATNLLISLKDEIMEIMKDPAVDRIIQPDTTAISEQFDTLFAALTSAKVFAETVSYAHSEQKYFSQFEVIDGVGQHPSGLSFEDWLKFESLITNFGQPKPHSRPADDIDEADAMFRQHQQMKEAHRQIYGD